MASGQQTVLIRNVCEWARIISAGQEKKLSCHCTFERVIMAFETGNFVVSRGLPLFIIGRDVVADTAVFGRGEYVIFQSKKTYEHHNYKDDS